jgi:hypothetical protein
MYQSQATCVPLSWSIDSISTSNNELVGECVICILVHLLSHDGKFVCEQVFMLYCNFVKYLYVTWQGTMFGLWVLLLESATVFLAFTVLFLSFYHTNTMSSATSAQQFITQLMTSPQNRALAMEADTIRGLLGFARQLQPGDPRHVEYRGKIGQILVSLNLGSFCVLSKWSCSSSVCKPLYQRQQCSTPFSYRRQ